MNAHRFKSAFCMSLGFFMATAAAQQTLKPALGNQILARQRSTKFLAERGIGPSSVHTQSAAQMLSHARAQYHRQAQQSSSTPVPAWQPVGPTQVTTSAYGSVAGRVTSIAVDPSDSTGNTVYVGTASGGVWKSTNAAGPAASVTLAPLTDAVYSSLGQTANAPSLSIGAVSVQPVSAGATPVILAGTGDPNDTTASYFGSGILRSTDGGNQWMLVSGSSDRNNGANSNFSFMGNGFAGFAWGSVGGNPMVVAAVSQAAQSVEVNAGSATPSVLGIYYSTDLGQTWYMATITDPGGTVQSSQTSFAPCQVAGSRLPCGNAVTSIVWNPVRKQFYAAVRFHGYYQSPDGQNWTRLTNQPAANLTVSMCPADLGYPGSQACPIYNGALAVQPVSGDTFALTTDINNLDQGLWQDACQLNSGACASSTLAFTQIPDAALDAGALNPSQPTQIPQADYDLYLTAIPSQQGSQPDTLLFAGTADIYRCDLGQGCAWRNTTHAQSSDCNSAQVAPAQYAIDATFGAAGLLYFGNDGGFWRSTDDVNQQLPQCSADDATHFQNLNAGFTGSIAEVESLALDPANPESMMVSLGPLGTAAPLTAGAPWQQVLDGEGDYAAIDPANPQNWYATSEFGIGINLCTVGKSCGIAAFGSPVMDSADVGNDGYGQIIPAPWILDPQDTANLILGTCRVWRGPASGGLQSQLSTMLDSNNGPYCDGNAEIRSLAASGRPSDPQGTAEWIYAGMAGLYDGGATVAGHVFAQSVGSTTTPSLWIDLSHNLNNFNPNGYDISSIYVDPHSPGGQTVYVTVQGFGTIQIYQSTDGGSIWQNISNDLTDVPANSVIVDPNNANVVYAATDAGVYYTQNVSSCGQPTSNCWSPFGSGLPNVPVVQLTAESTGSGSAVLAATYGRGVWQIGLPTASTTTATAAPTALVFASQPAETTSAAQQVLITNTGTVPLKTSTIVITRAFTETDTCTGESIAPGATCVLEVRFSPAATGLQSGLLTLYANLAGGQLTVPLSGTGVQGAAITLTPSALCFQATLIGQTTSASCQSGPAPQQVQSIVIANTGAATTNLTSISISGDFAISANTCGSSLAPANTANDSCTLNITFTPTASGNRTGMFAVTDNTGTQTAQLVGTGQTPATDVLAPLSLSFGSQTVGSASVGQQLTLTNNGDLTVLAIAVQTSTTDFIAANNCGTTLAGHSSCAILVSFLPTTLGAENGILTVSDIVAQGATASAHTQQVILTGAGIAPAGIVSAAPSSLGFYYAADASPAYSPAQTVTITNNGSSTVTGTQAAITGNFAIAANSCTTPLPIGGTCSIGVDFAPTAQVTEFTGSLTITGTNLSAPLVVSLSGNRAGFTMQVSGSSSQVITGGQAASPFTVDINSMSGSTGLVDLTCAVTPSTSGLPPATCTVPPSVFLTGTSGQSASVTLATNQQAKAINSDWKAVSLALAMLVPAGLFGSRRRKRRAFAACVFLILLFPLGCGVSSSSGQGNGPPPSSGQYTLTVTGTVPGLTQTVTMRVTIQ